MMDSDFPLLLWLLFLSYILQWLEIIFPCNTFTVKRAPAGFVEFIPQHPPKAQQYVLVLYFHPCSLTLSTLIGPTVTRTYPVGTDAVATYTWAYAAFLLYPTNTSCWPVNPCPVFVETTDMICNFCRLQSYPPLWIIECGQSRNNLTFWGMYLFLDW